MAWRTTRRFDAALEGAGHVRRTSTKSPRHRAGSLGRHACPSRARAQRPARAAGRRAAEHGRRRPVGLRLRGHPATAGAPRASARTARASRTSRRPSAAVRRRQQRRRSPTGSPGKRSRAERLRSCAAPPSPRRRVPARLRRPRAAAARQGGGSSSGARRVAFQARCAALAFVLASAMQRLGFCRSRGGATSYRAERCCGRRGRMAAQRVISMRRDAAWLAILDAVQSVPCVKAGQQVILACLVSYRPLVNLGRGARR